MTVLVSDLPWIACRICPAVLYGWKRLVRGTRMGRTWIFNLPLRRTVAVDVHLDRRTGLVWCSPADPEARACCGREWRITTRRIVAAVLRDSPEAFDDPEPRRLARCTPQP